MATKQIDLDDFSGGFTLEEHPSAFREGMWSRLDGFVFDSANRMRSQWPTYRVEQGGEAWDVMSFDDIMVAVDGATGEVKGADVEPYQEHYDGGPGATGADHLSNPTWNSIDVYDYNPSGADTLVSSTLTVGVWSDSPYRTLMGAVKLTGEFGPYNTGLLVTDATDANYHYLVVTRSMAYRLPAQKTASSFASGDYPWAYTVGQWSDFTIWANIYWHNDPDAGTGFRFYESGLWFSQPGQFDEYDTTDVVFLPSSTGEVGKVLDMHELPDGLLVLTESETFFLRGTADNFTIESLSSGGTSLGSYGGAAYVPRLRAVAWCDVKGRVWLSDGTALRRIDDTVSGADLTNLLTPDNADLTSYRNGGRFAPSCAALGDTLVVSREAGHDLLCFHLLPGNEGAWTRLKLPDFGSSGSDDFAPVFLGASAPMGGVFLIHQAFTSSSSNRLVYLDVADATRSKRGGYFYWDSGSGAQLSANTDLTLGTPVLSGDGHNRSWWRKVGVRLGRTTDEDAELVKVTQWTTGGDVDGRADGTFSDVHASTDLDDGLAFSTALHTNVVHRKHVIVPGIGPTRHMRAEFVFNGDVTVEGVTVWADGASRDRGRGEAQAGTPTTYE